MKLITKESESRSRIDELAQVQHSVGSGSFIVYFYVSKEIAGETLDKSLDTGLPLMIPVELISEALDIIYQKALELRAVQLDLLGKDSFIARKPNYKDFYSELLTTELFAMIRREADKSLQVNTAYTDFALALTSSIIGNENEIAFQFCLNQMLDAMGDSILLEQVEVLGNLIEKYKLPIAIPEPVQSPRMSPIE